MGRKAKFSFEIKINIVRRCLAGKTSANQEAQLLGICGTRVLERISLYQSLEGRVKEYGRSYACIYNLEKAKPTANSWLREGIYEIIYVNFTCC